MSKTDISPSDQCGPRFQVAEPHDLSPRAKWLREYFFKGASRSWNNEYSPFTTGAPWGDHIWNEGDFYIVPEVFGFFGVKGKGLFGLSLAEMAQKVPVPEKFWTLSLPERRAIFFQEIMLNALPREIIGDMDLIAGGRFNIQSSKCLTQKELKEFEKRNLANRQKTLRFHVEGFGNVGATAGHVIVDYATVVQKGFKFLSDKIQNALQKLTESEKQGNKGQELRAMLTMVEIPKKIGQKYREECLNLAQHAQTEQRKQELLQMAENLERVPWEPATTFWEALQTVWLCHMLVMAEENYPGPGTSFGRLDQYLWPYFQQDVIQKKTLTRDMAKELFGTFMFHCNTAYDAQIRIGNQGITAGFGQLMTLSGLGPHGEDLTNELTYLILEVFDEWAPILEPKPNIRLHRGTPDRLLDIAIKMITRSQGAPFILNFDERSIAGMIAEGVPKEEAWDYACVGCLENTMCGNDRSGTVNCNPNLAKSIELTLWNGQNQPEFKRIFGDGKLFTQLKDGTQIGPKTGNPAKFETWDQFFSAWKTQMEFLIRHTVETYNIFEQFRKDFVPTPYTSLLIDGCIENGADIRSAPPKYGFITIEGVGFATLVDSLLAIKKFVYDEKRYTIDQVKLALKQNFGGSQEFSIMQTLFQNKAPKYGNDNHESDTIAQAVMKIWGDECWKYKTPTQFQFRPGMLSWNYWAGADASYTPATPNGRLASTFLSNAICPTNGSDTHGPTSVANSVGSALGGKDQMGQYLNCLPNGASHTITFNPSLLRDAEHREKFKAYLKGYIENGGTALQINILDAEMLRDAQLHPQNYQNLLVRVTGYNAYFTSVGKELQDEIIARESHQW